MSAATIVAGAAGVLQLGGVLDYRSGPALRDEVQRLIFATSGAVVVLDCSTIEHSSSVGLSLLLAFTRDAQKAGKRLELSNVPEEMREIAKVSNLDMLFGTSA